MTSAGPEQVPASPQAPVGSGGRFAALKSTLSEKKDVDDPGALAAKIGMMKYGKAAFAKMAAKGRKNAQEGN